MIRLWKSVVTLTVLAVVGTALAWGAEPKAVPGNYKRVVLLRFKETTSPARVEELLQGIRALGPKIPAIASLDVGTSNGDAALTQGYTHVVLVTFRTTEDRSDFLANTTHKKYEKEVLDPELERALVIEFLAP